MNYWGGGWFGSYWELEVDDGAAPSVTFLFSPTLSVSADDDPSVTFTFDMTLTASGGAVGVVAPPIKHRADISPDTVEHVAP